MKLHVYNFLIMLDMNWNNQSIVNIANYTIDSVLFRLPSESGESIVQKQGSSVL